MRDHFHFHFPEIPEEPFGVIPHISVIKEQGKGVRRDGGSGGVLIPMVDWVLIPMVDWVLIPMVD